MRAFGDLIDPNHTRWDPIQRRVRYVIQPFSVRWLLICFVRCMEHSIHLGAGHFISRVNPTSATKIIKKVKAAFEKANGDDEDPELNANINAALEAEDGEEGDDAEDVDFEVADTIGKALALVQQVRLSVIS
jgi:hypothetical protein